MSENTDLKQQCEKSTFLIKGGPARHLFIILISVCIFFSGMVLFFILITDNFNHPPNIVFNEEILCCNSKEFCEELPAGGPVEIEEIDFDRFSFSFAKDPLDTLILNIHAYGIGEEEMLEAIETARDNPSAIPMGWPVKGVVSSCFGRRKDPITRRRAMHKGLDICAPRNRPILATADGVVKIAGWQRGYGRVVYIDHGNGFVTRYAHMQKILVKRRAKVECGDQIGKVGSSGRATGPHLHYEVRWKKKALNPEPFILVEE